MPQVDARRTQERVLRIVFQPYIDDRGRLHEASAVHAVVQSGEWQQEALAYATPIPARGAAASASPMESLAEAVDRADLASTRAPIIDPNLPDTAVVAAARARAADPVQAIQNDVAARLAPKAGRTPARSSPEVSKERAESRSAETSTPARPGSSPKPMTGKAAPTAFPEVTAAPAAPAKTTVATEAVTRIKTSPEYQARAAQAEADARAAGQTGSLPESEIKGQVTVRAAGFPAAVPEEN